MSTNDSNTNPPVTKQPSSDNLEELMKRLEELINEGRLYIMDEENGVAFPAWTVIKYKNNKLLISCPR